MNRSILFAAWSLAALAVGSPPSRAAAAPDCSLQRYASIDLVLPDRGGVLVPVGINGKNVLMAFDMGSGYSLIGQHAASALGLHTKSLPFGAATITNGRTQLKTYVPVANFSLGALMLNAYLLVVPAPAGSPADVTPDINSNSVVGAVGMNTFVNMDVEVDLANRKLNLYSPQHCLGHVVYWSQNYAAIPFNRGQTGSLFFPMQLNGKPILTTFSTGAADTVLFADVAKQIYGLDPGFSGADTTHVLPMDLVAQGLSVAHAKITLSDQVAPSICQLSRQARVLAPTGRIEAIGYIGCGNVYPLHLGLNVLKQLHFYIAAKEQMLYFTAAGPPQ